MCEPCYARRYPGWSVDYYRALVGATLLQLATFGLLEEVHP
jgi:hypothetical protein